MSLHACRFDIKPYINPSLPLATAMQWPLPAPDANDTPVASGAASDPKPAEDELFPWGDLPVLFYNDMFDVLSPCWPKTVNDGCGKQQRVPRTGEGVAPRYLDAYWKWVEGASDQDGSTEDDSSGSEKHGVAAQGRASGDGRAAIEMEAAAKQLRTLLRVRVLALRWLEERMHAALGKRGPRPAHLALSDQFLMDAVSYPQKQHAMNAATATGGFLSGDVRSSLLDAAWDALVLNRSSGAKDIIRTVTGR